MSLQHYRIEAGTPYGDSVVAWADVQDGRIVDVPPIWHKFQGQPLHRLEWWLTAKYSTCQVRRVWDAEVANG